MLWDIVYRLIPECGFPAIESNGKFGSIETKDELGSLLEAVKTRLRTIELSFGESYIRQWEERWTWRGEGCRCS